MKKILIVMIGVFFIITLIGRPAFAEKREALIIGNGDYANSPPLRNPVNDARDIAAALKRVGFDVIHKENISLRVMEESVREFGRRLSQADVGLFFYSGHGMQVKGANYLIPTDAKLYRESDVRYEALDMGRILDEMNASGCPMTVVILDACRDNPLARSSRSTRGGLAEMLAPTGSFIAFATAPGSTADDGTGRNGVFTQHLLRYMEQPGLSIEEVMKRVRVGVISDTQSRQVPWQSSSMTGDFYFVPGKARPSSPTTVASLSNTPASVPDAPPPPKLDEIWDRKNAGPSDDPVRTQWAEWQNKMASEYKKLEMFDQGSSGEPRDKIAAWDWFIKMYSSDNPFSRQDDQLREQARSRFDYWRMGEQQTVSVKSAPAMPVPQPVAAPSGETFTNSLGMNFALIPAGAYLRGSPPNEYGREPSERQHEVQLTHPFYLQTTEVTQGQYQKVMNNNPSKYKNCGPDCPVDSVSWRNAQEFIKRLNQMEGTNTYRLPTEAEWEYACRAGNATSFANGQISPSGYANDPLLDQIGWYAVNAGNSPKPVARKMANNWGLYDMHGNVWEMVQDHFGEYPSGTVVDPVGPTGGPIVIRGGNWKSLPKYCRCADRKQGNPGQGGYLTGFRLAKTR